MAGTVLGTVTIAVWPAFAARRASPRPLIMSVYGSAAVTAVFVALLGRRQNRGSPAVDSACAGLVPREQVLGLRHRR